MNFLFGNFSFKIVSYPIQKRTEQMAEQRPLSEGAKKLKKRIEKARVENANKRARGQKSSGSLEEKARKAAKKAPEKRGLPARIEKSRGDVNKAETPKEIRLKGEGGTGRSVKDTRFKPVPLGDRPKALPAPRSNVRTFNPGAAAGRLLGPAGFLVGMTEPAGSPEESATIRRDRSYGPLMRGGRQPGYTYRDSQTVDRSGKGDYASGKGDREVKAAPKPTARPARSEKAAEFRKKMQGRAAEKKAVPARKPIQRVSFKGNWVGAAPTAMQKRGGQAIKRPNLMSFLKGK